MTYGPLAQLGVGKCNAPVKTLTRFLGSTDPEERRLAAWVAGESKIKELKPLLQRLATSDQYFNTDDHSYPVRNAAVTALTQIDAK